MCKACALPPSHAAAHAACFGCPWDFLDTAFSHCLSPGGRSHGPGSPGSSCVGLMPPCRSLTGCLCLLLLQRRWYQTENEYYLLQFTLTVRCLFYTSFSLELCRQPPPAQRAPYSFLWLLAYVFYYPVFHNGPILNFPEFFRQVESSGGPQVGLHTECGVHKQFGNSKRLLNVQPKIIQSNG